MTTKQLLLTLTMIASSTFAANADPVTPVGPSAVPANGTAVVATAPAPYVTITPTAADETHIATTAYVKGAYNDAIAAVNKLDSDKQGKIINDETGRAMENMALGSVAGDDIVREVFLNDNLQTNLLSRFLVAGDGLSGAVKAVKDYIAAQQVAVYTTWDSDDITSVSLTNGF